MDYIRSTITTNKNVQKATEDVFRKLHEKPLLVLFFASTAYDFDQLTALFHKQYPDAEVVGITTTGELGPNGFSENSLSAQSYATSFGKVKAMLMKDIEKYPIFDRPHLIDAATSVGIQLNATHIENEGLAYVFPVGLKAGEEKMLSVVNSIFKNNGFPIFGGTAGDDAKFIETKVSVNGDVTNSGCATVFLKPSIDFIIYKENIFEGTGQKVKITKADVGKRIIYELDGKRAADVYAAKLNVPVSELSKHLALHPMGREMNETHLIASPFKIEEHGAISFYCQMYEGATVEILKPKDVFEELEKTVQALGQFKTIHGLLVCNCILRKMQFERENLFPVINQQLKEVPNLCGFSSYGEQLNKSQLNQTLLLVGFGDKKGAR